MPSVYRCDGCQTKKDKYAQIGQKIKSGNDFREFIDGKGDGYWWEI